MSIADELNHYAGGLEDAYDAVNDMNGVIPANRNMDNLDTAIRTIPQPTVNDGTLTIQKNGTSVATFTANQASNATANITVPTNTSDLNNDSGFITSSSLPGDMTGATSGAAGAHGLVPAPSAGDEDKVLSGAGTWVSQPTVPTVNDGTLTITQGGTTLGTFTANQSGNTTVSIAASSDPGTVFYVLGDDGDGYGIYNITVDSGSLSCDIYSDQAMTTAITGYEFDAAFEAGPVKLMVYADGYGTWDEAYVTICTADDSEYPDYQQYSFFIASKSLTNGAYYVHRFAFRSNGLASQTPFDFSHYIIQSELIAGSNITIGSDGRTISATDTTYSAFTGATSSVAGTAGLVPAPTTSDPGKFLKGDGTWATPSAQLVEMAYGESNAWAKFIAAYQAKCIVYCRASSNANPGTGAKTRKAFMAYVNNEDNPTSVEFQYVRSVGTKSDSQQCDQVFVYTLTNASGGTWSVATRDMATKVNVDSTLTKTYSGGANASVTLSAKAMTGATSGTAGTAGYVPAPAAGDEGKVLSGAGTWVNQPTVNDATLTIQHNGTDVQTFTANQSTNATANIATIYAVDAIDTTAVTPTVTADMIDWSTMRATLWTNPNPTSNFATTTFTIANLSAWDYIAVIARTHTSQNQMNMFKVKYSNGGIEISFADNSNTMDRNITWNGNSVTISGGRLGASSDDSRCVPVEIIGMKY